MRMKKWLKNLIGELFGFHETQANMAIAFNNLSTFVFDNAAMPDKAGKTEEPYNSEEVAAMWNEYHNLCDAFYRSRGKRQ